MKKSYFITALSVVALGLSAMAVKAGTNWVGPPGGCTSPSTPGCNTNGVIWNQTTAQNGASFNVGGTGTVGTNLSVGGTGTIGSGLIVTNGGLETKSSGSSFIGDGTTPSDLRIRNGNLYLANGKAIRIDSPGISNLYIGNWDAAGQYVSTTIYGDVVVAGTAGHLNPQICFGTDCRSSWPSAGGSGTITGVTAGTGLTGGGATGSVTLNVGAGTGITVAADTVGLDTTFTNNMYVNVTGDTMTNSLFVTNPAASYAVQGLGIQGVVGRGSGSGGIGVQGSIDSTVTNGYAGIFNAGTANGASYGLYVVGSSGGPAAYLRNGANTNEVIIGGATAGGDALTVSGRSVLNGDLKMNPTRQICFDTDCRSSWPVSGAGTITGVTASTGLTGGGTTGNVSLALAPSYRLPQVGCTGLNLVSKWNGSAWICAADLDTNSGGTLTGVDPITSWGLKVNTPNGSRPQIGLMDCPINNTVFYNGSSWVCSTAAWNVTAGNGLTGGGSSYPTLNIGAGNGITVAADTVSADTAYLNGLYLQDKLGGRSCTSNAIAAGAATVTCPVGQYMAGITKNASNVITSVNCCTLDD